MNFVNDIFKYKREWRANPLKRSSGVLMHISSLPNNYGIGSFGKEAYDFVDFLVSTGQSYWQILPLTTTSYGDSPYASYSAFAGNTDFINLDLLRDSAYLEKKDFQELNFGKCPSKVNYGQVQKERRPLLEKAVKKFVAKGGLKKVDYIDFLKKNDDWLLPFSYFMTLKEKFNQKPWFEWPEEYREFMSENVNVYLENKRNRVLYYLITQYWFSKQWKSLKKYANRNHLSIIGDIPIYIAYDSVEMWETPEMFKVDENNIPTAVSGTPPDGFSDEGQYWGNPIYNWQEMEKNNFQWWARRINQNLKLYDYVRLDHFRGFEAYWEIPFGAESAKEGKWVKGPDKKLFKALEEELGEMNLIAEDLGYITEEVEDLLDYTNYPGMKILQHAFNATDENEHMPHNYRQNTVAYVGTHDNETAYGWYLDSTNQNQRDQLDQYLNRRAGEPIADALNRGLAASVSNVVIYTMQDLLGLGNEARMNRPSTIGDNWDWRMNKDGLSIDLEEKLLGWTKTYYRVNSALKNEKSKGEKDA